MKEIMIFFLIVGMANIVTSLMFQDEETNSAIEQLTNKKKLLIVLMVLTIGSVMHIALWCKKRSNQVNRLTPLELGMLEYIPTFSLVIYILIILLPFYLKS